MNYANQGMQIGGASPILKSQAPPRANAVSAMVARLHDKSGILVDLCRRADAIASGLDGPEPPAEGLKGENPRPPSLVGSLEYFDMQFDGLLNDLRRHLSRIETALG